MSTIAIVGAGPQLGLAIARRFAMGGFDVALIARTRATLDAMAAELTATGVRAAGFCADLNDRSRLRGALLAAERQLGPIDVLEFSPAPSPDDLRARPFAEAAGVTVESVVPEFETWVLGAITAVGQVLPGMLARGRGTVLATTGAGSGPMIVPIVANVQVATAGLRNWILNLNASLAGRGVYAAHVAIAAVINDGRPEMSPAAIADAYFRMHIERDVPELVYPAIPDPDVLPELAEKNRAGLPAAE